MERKDSILMTLVLAALMLFSTSVAAQVAVTKSGTSILPPPCSSNTVFPSTKHAVNTLSESSTYLAVIPSDLLTAMQPFLRWKRQQGYNVEVLCVNHPTRDSLRSQLRTRYEKTSPLFPPQRYVLLVGDVDQIPAFNGTHVPTGLSTHVTDLYYGEYSDDCIPEAWVGRLSVADSTQLSAVIAKIISYEKGLYASSNRLLFTAGHEQRSPAPVTTNGQVNYLSSLAAEHRTGTDTVCIRNHSEETPIDSVINLLNHPNALVNYTAHCTSTGWSNPFITGAIIDTLNEATPTVYVNNCCLSNAFNNAHCFGEELLRQSDGGAVSVIGATNETLWAEDYYFAVGAKYPLSLHPALDSATPGAFDYAFCQRSYQADSLSLGALMYAGCKAVTQAGSPYHEFYWEAYNLLGDPSLTMFFGQADTLSLTIDDTLWAGTTSLAVRSNPFTRISATIDTFLLATTMTDSLGISHLLLPNALYGDSITLTAWRPESIAETLRLPISTPSEGRLAVTHAVVTNDSLQILIRNVGSNDSESRQLTISQENDLQGSARLPETISIPIEALNSGANTSVVIPLDNMIMGEEPILRINLSFSGSADTLRTTLPLPDLRPTLTLFSPQQPDNTTAHALLPDSTYRIVIELSHIADSLEFTWDGTGQNLYGDSVFTPSVAIPQEIQHIPFSLTPHRGLYSRTYNGYLTVGKAYETFETDDFNNLPWQSPNLYPWQTDTLNPHEGHYSAKSYPIDHGQRSTMTLDLYCLTTDSISFYYNVSSEASDWLYFFVDGQRRGYWSGNSGWQRYARLLSAGHHQLQWVYQKDASGTEREDCARIDDIHLPLAWWETPVGQSVVDTSLPEEIEILSENDRVFEIAPNPASELAIFTLTPSPTAREIVLYDMLGQRVDTIKVAPNCNSVQYYTTHLRSSMFVAVLHDAQQTSTRKLIVTHR